MLFSSPLFLFRFLPFVLALQFVLPRASHNLLLLTASLVFYAWGEPIGVGLLVGCIAVNFGFGQWLGRRSRRWILSLAVIVNLGVLIAFKYAHFLGDNLGLLLGQRLEVPTLPLPLGISFFTFQAVSYVIDVYRGTVPAAGSLTAFALYIAYFPQAIAGPIVRYQDVVHQMAHRRVTLRGLAAGSQRFIVGLAKKLLLADTLARPADALFALPAAELSLGLAWLASTCYALQIYFDFSGYSDMAIGLARMSGFRFRENFRAPYAAESITDFWRRWHISLSTWFRDYVYIPLGGNRCRPLRVYANLVIVFVLCGLWHGANWTFLVWGLYHGFFLVVERLGLSRWLQRLGRLPSHVYTLLIVVFGWVLFRAETLAQAGGIIEAMLGMAAGNGEVHAVGLYLTNDVGLALLVGGLAATAPGSWMAGWAAAVVGFPRPTGRAEPLRHAALAVARLTWLGGLLVAAGMVLAASTHHPFIYFRF
ncbi:MAG: MBOAT family protein [Gemmataceae bacterium]|nr:MBOAT family protein [Gemmataceae bacterium]MDW8265439.1 MBOAT family protein [Gemmataceae bacterium]